MPIKNKHCFPLLVYPEPPHPQSCCHLWSVWRAEVKRWSNGQPQGALSVQNHVHQPTKHPPALFPLQQQNTETWIHLKPMPQPSFQYLHSSSATALDFPGHNSIDLVLIPMATEFMTIFVCAMCLEVLFLASEDGVPTTALLVRPFEHLSAESLNLSPCSNSQLSVLGKGMPREGMKPPKVPTMGPLWQQPILPPTEKPKPSLHSLIPTFSKIPSVSIVPLLLRQLCVHHIGPSFASSDRASKLALYLKMLLESHFLFPKASLLTFLPLFLLQNHVYFYRRWGKGVWQHIFKKHSSAAKWSASKTKSSSGRGLSCEPKYF